MTKSAKKTVPTTEQKNDDFGIANFVKRSSPNGGKIFLAASGNNLNEVTEGQQPEEKKKAQTEMKHKLLVQTKLFFIHTAR